MSANGFRGNLVEPSRAGITTKKSGVVLDAVLDEVLEFIKDRFRMN